MTKPNFIKKRLILLFESDDIKEQKKILNKYNNYRNLQKEKDCYCGHTIDCDCGNPGISEFKNALINNNISEKILNKII